MTLLAERAYARPFQKAPRSHLTQTRVEPSAYRPSWGARPNRALARATAQLRALSGIRPTATLEMHRLLRTSLQDDTAYATISPDGDGGLIAQWRAGRSYITIELSAEDASFTCADIDGRLIANIVTPGQLDADQVRYALARFTHALVKANPNWRQNFA
ncbi:MAG: hypothetical protein ACTHNQ_03810 [Microbacterium sp.]|uniref:hypothetical protein n=1 Tax=Microbacterium sp. TaxID=51671 RepID=UPI003F7F0B94